MKNLIKLIVSMILLAFMLPHYADAAENKNDSIVNSDINTNKVKITGSESQDSVNINIDLETVKETVYADLNLSFKEDDSDIVNVITEDEHGNVTNTTYQLDILELSNEVIKAKLFDDKSGEEIIIDTTQVKATVVPVVIALIVRAGLQFAIKHYGKKLAMRAFIEYATSKIADAYGGSVKEAKNGKGKVITIPNKKQTIVIRLMEAGSGGRKEAYWRMSVGNKSINRAGNFSNNASETHISLQESSLSTILNLIKKYKK